MTMTVDQIIEVLHAYKDGKIVEYKHDLDTQWRSLSSTPAWNFSVHDYRIKKEPRQYTILLNAHGLPVGVSTKYGSGVVIELPTTKNPFDVVHSYVTVQEVL